MAGLMRGAMAAVLVGLALGGAPAAALAQASVRHDGLRADPMRRSS